jgi:hypothetical protein
MQGSSDDEFAVSGYVEQQASKVPKRKKAPSR